MKIVLLASGTGSLAQAIIDAKRAGDLDLEILALVSDRESQVLQRASSAGIIAKHLPMTSDLEIWDTQLLDYVSDLKPDLVVSVGFMRILAKAFVENFRTINTHPALLPNFPGAHGVRDALAAGVTKTGATLHWVDSGVDTGAIIAQKEVEVFPTDDESTLHERIKIVERALIVETLKNFIISGIPGRI
jgi:phosphoribosylglycinamide formyltransferase-1